MAGDPHSGSENRPLSEPVSHRLSFVLLLVIAIALSATAIWTAWDFGGGYRSTKWVMTLVALGLIPIAVIACLLDRQARCKPPAVAVIAFAVWAIGLLQCAALPSSWVETFAPGSAAAYQEWIPESVWQESATASPPGPENRDQSISVAPSYTQMALAGPAAFAATCWLAAICFTRWRAGLLFLTTTATAGGVFAFFGLADALRLARDENIELRQRLIIAPIGADGPFGPFVNNNNCAGYLCLTIGCGLGILAYLVPNVFLPRNGENRPGETSSPGGSKRTAGIVSRFLRISTNPVSMLRQWRVAACLLVIVVMVAGILGSASRGGFMGLVVGSITLALVALRVVPKTRFIVTAIVIVSVALLVLAGAGMLEHAEARLQTLVEGEAQKDPRLSHWKDGLAAAKEYFPAGAGLGTYRFAHLPYQQHGSDRWFAHADGMQVEWLVEGGLWLLPMIALGLLWVAGDLRRIARRLPELEHEETKLALALITTGVFVLPSMVVTQCFDYGILQPPLLLTFAVICGGIHRLAKPPDSRDADERPGRLPWLGCIGMCAALVLGLALAADRLYVGMVVQQGELLRKSQRRQPVGELPSYEERLKQLESLVQRQPKNSAARLLLAQLLIDQQRRLGARYLYDQQLGTPEELQRWVSPRTVRQAYYGVKTSRPIEELMLPPQEIQRWRAARAHAAVALALGPLDDSARFLLVELDMVHDRAGQSSASLIDQAARLRRGNRRSLQQLERLAEVYPGAETTQKIRQWRQRQQKNADR